MMKTFFKIILLLLTLNSYSDCLDFQNSFNGYLKSVKLSSEKINDFVSFTQENGLFDIKNRDRGCWRKLLKLSKESLQIDKVDYLFFKAFLIGNIKPSLLNLFILKNKREKRLRSFRERELSLTSKLNLNKLYKKKIKGIGKVGVDTYLYSYYSSKQIIAMANLFKKVSRLKAYSYFEMRASHDPFEGERNNTLTYNLSKLITALDNAYDDERDLSEAEKKVFKQRVQELESILRKYSDEKKIVNTKELNLSNMINSLKENDDSLEGLDHLYDLLASYENFLYKQSSEENQSILIPPADAYRLITNHLKDLVRKLPRSDKTNFKYAPPMQDVLLSAYVVGVFSDDRVIEELSERSHFKRNKNSVWSIVKGIVLPLGSTLAAVNPVTAMVFLGVSITLDTVSNIKKQKKDNSRETHLVPSSY